MTTNAQRQWWEEDAERINQMCKAAKRRGYLIKIDQGSSPTLNPNGSLTKASIEQETDSTQSPGDGDWEEIGRR